MARASSLNVEVVVNGYTIYPLELGEVGEGEEGRIDVADGGRKYKVRDQIFDIGEIPITILLTNTGLAIASDGTQASAGLSEYSEMQAWCTSGAVYDVFVIFRDSAQTAVLTYQFSNTQCAMGKKNAFNRNSKEVDTKQYTLLPEFIEQV